MSFLHIAHVWLLAGFVWFVLGMAWAPSNKLYQQGLVALFWLPGLLLLWPARERWLELWRESRMLLLALLALVLWAWISVLWSVAEEPMREAKRVLYVLLFLAGVVILAGTEPQRLVRPLQVAGFGLALAALVALVEHYGLEQKPLLWRVQGLGLLDHPIIGGYAVGLAMIWLFCLPPQRLWARLCWGLALLVLVTFMAMTQSRGAWLALLGSMLLMPLWRSGRDSWIVPALLLMVALLGYWQFEALVLARGSSFRVEILAASVQMIAEHPLLGLGLGSGYEVRVDTLNFDHSHNAFTHTAIELGLPGLVLWGILWAGTGWTGWQTRSTALGGALLGMWLFASLALLFDGASLWDSPRPEWLLTWLPVSLALVLCGSRKESL